MNKRDKADKRELKGRQGERTRNSSRVVVVAGCSMEQTAIQLPEIVTPAVTDEYLGGIGTAPISVSTDFLLRKSSCVHYGAPSVLANFYHHPGVTTKSLARKNERRRNERREEERSERKTK